jgi:hypothetical protein
MRANAAVTQRPGLGTECQDRRNKHKRRDWHYCTCGILAWPASSRKSSPSDAKCPCRRILWINPVRHCRISLVILQLWRPLRQSIGPSGYHQQLRGAPARSRYRSVRTLQSARTTGIVRRQRAVGWRTCPRGSEAPSGIGPSSRRPSSSRPSTR